MKNFLVSLFIISLCFSCDSSKKNNTTITQLIPESTAVILKINSLETFKSDLKNNSLIKNLSSMQFYNHLNTSLNSLKNLKINNEVLICYEKSNDSLTYTIITKNHDSLIQNNDSIKLFKTVVDSVFVASNSNIIINAASVKEQNDFSVFTKVLSNNKSFQFY